MKGSNNFDDTTGHEKMVLVVYATETGSSEALAYSTYQELYLRGVDISVKNAYSVSPAILGRYGRVIFMVSTAAYGEFTHSMQRLAGELRGWREEIKWSYTVFGLGDSRYPLFNHAARKLVTILESIKATAFYRIAYGDEQHPLGHLGEFMTWITGMKQQWDLSISGVLRPLKFCLSVETLGKNVNEEDVNIKCNTGKIVSNEVITSSCHFRSVRNVVIDCFAERYYPGDVCCIYPTGDPEVVAECLSHLGFYPDEIIKIRRQPRDNLEYNNDILVISQEKNYQDSAMEETHLSYEGHPMKLKTLFFRFLSLANLCTQWQMYIMAMFTDVEIHKTKLQEMSSFSIEGCAEYNRYCKDERRSLYEVLRDFDSVKLPLEVLINIATPYYPRMYSIASTPSTIGIGRPGASIFEGTPSMVSYPEFKSFLKQKSKRNALMELCLAQVTHNTPYNRKIEGQASDFFIKSSLHEVVRFTIMQSKIARAVLDVSFPVLFICTGTGMAAVKPLLEARIEKLRHIWNNHFRRPRERDLAFFGFRRKRQDHLYLGDMRLLSMFCDVEFVYSRESGKKVYVQDAITNFSERVIEILMKGIVYIAGRSHPMPKQVMDRLRDMLVDHAGFGIRAADKFVESALAGRKIILDTWG